MISLCMIVRDEEAMLPRFLEHARGLYDELCVVDTGSKDRSVDLLRAAGARVVERPWTDDFSAARNTSLELATGDVIVYLDADEMASAELVRDVRTAAATASVGAATLRMVNPLPNGHRREAHLLRLWRNDPSIRFSYPIHEDVTTAVSAFLARTGLELASLSGHADHLGYVRERAVGKAKKERDVKLLRRCLEQDRRDLYAWFKLLELARYWEDRPLWSGTAREAQRVLAELGRQALKDRHYAGELVVLLADGLHASDPQGALRVINAWADRMPPSATLFVRRGELWETLGDLHRAALDFGRALEHAGATANLQMAQVRPLLGLARLALASKELWRAWSLTEEALTHNPRDPEALLAAVHICQMAGGATGVSEFVRAFEMRYGQAQELTDALATLRTLTPAA